MADYVYKGYRISTRRAVDGWGAVIYAPRSSLAEKHLPESTNEEGESVCLLRAYAYVDGKLAEAKKKAEAKKD